MTDSNDGGASARDDALDALLAEVAAAPPIHTAGAEDLLIGRTVGRFVLHERIGKGGMGVVYRARDPDLARDVALKLLADDDARDPTRRARFLREARAAAQLSHPSIAQIHEVGFDDAQQIGFIAMEFVDGRDLRRVLSAAGAGAGVATGGLPLVDVERLALQIARALARAHAVGIVHRDLKPENVMLTADGDAKILDFGLAKHVDRATDAARPSDGVATTREGTVVGTPGYMAPEQVLGRAVDARADIFSFGVLVHEMITGKAPFVGDTPMATAVAVTRDPPPAIDRVDARRAVVDVVRRCLEKEASARFADGRALVDALAAALETNAASGPLMVPTGLRSGANGNAGGSVATIETPNVATTALRAGERGRARAMLLALVALGVIAAIAIALVSKQRGASSEPASLASISIVSNDPTTQSAFRAAVLALYDGDRNGTRRNIEVVLNKDKDAALPHLLFALHGGADGFASLKSARDAASRRPPPKAQEEAIAVIEAFATPGPDRLALVVERYDAHVRAHPNEYFLHLLMLTSIRPSLDAPLVVERAARLHALDASPPLLIVLESVSLRRAGRVADASALVEAALRSSPDHMELLMQRAQLLGVTGRLREAIAVNEGVVQRHPAEIMARYELLHQYLLVGDDEARARQVAALRSGLFAPGDSSPVLLAHGQQLAGAGRLADANVMFEAAAQLARAAGIWTLAVTARSVESDQLVAHHAWDRIPAVEAAVDELLAQPELAQPVRVSAQLSRLRNEARRRYFSGDRVGARTIIDRLEKLPDEHYFDARHRVLAFERALVAVDEGRAADAFDALAKGEIPPDTILLAPYWNAMRQFVIAQLLKDAAAEARGADALVALHDSCVAMFSDDVLQCRTLVARGLVSSAERALAAGDVALATTHVDRLEKIYDDKADAPIALRMRELRAKL